MNLIKKFWLIIVLVILLIVLLFIKIKYTNKTEVNINKQTNTNSEIIDIKTTLAPTKMSQNNQEDKNISSENVFKTDEGETINANDYKTEALSDEVSVDNLEPFLPYEGKYFTVKKYF